MVGVFFTCGTVEAASKAGGIQVVSSVGWKETDNYYLWNMEELSGERMWEK